MHGSTLGWMRVHVHDACTRMRGSALGMRGSALGCVGVHWDAWECTGMRGSALGCVGVHWMRRSALHWECVGVH